jgi:hypothetical protein
VWPQLVSLPLFPVMTVNEFDYVVENVKNVCRKASVAVVGA